MRWKRSARPRSLKFWRSKLTKIQHPLLSAHNKMEERVSSQLQSVGTKSSTSVGAPVVAVQRETSPQQHPSLRHLAIIMDGNRRWATKRHLPRLAGHKAGVTALRRTLECAVDEHIEMLSVYAFSTENWGRPRAEVEGLMRLFWETIRSDIEKLHRE